jgi:hypothetical protein
VAAERAWFSARGIDIAVASFAAPERLRAYQQAKQWPFPIYADPQRDVYRAFELRRLPWWNLLRSRVIGKYLKLLWKGGRIERTHGDDVRQGGGDFLVTNAGGLVYEYRSDDPADRPSIQSLKDAAERLPKYRPPG